MNGQQRVIIENIQPQVQSGAYPAKRVEGDKVIVRGDIFCDSHDMLTAEVLYRYETERKWRMASMEDCGNDLWRGEFTVEKTGNYVFTVQAWADKFKSWHRDTLKKLEGGTANRTDLRIGVELINRKVKTYDNMPVRDKDFFEKAVKDLDSEKQPIDQSAVKVLDHSIYKRAVKYPLRDHLVTYEKELVVEVDRKKAGFSSWYEVFPRSLGKNGKHGTFNDVIDFLPYVNHQGFDVLYLPPIHPIGETNRKGKNNNVKSKPGEPGSPWAIGSKEGGHKAIHPELGTLADFKKLVKAAGNHDIEIALDIAFQCSPDHPWVSDHPEWFNKRPDGTLQYAENPPKKYEDIYPLNFESAQWKALWEALKSVFLYWIDQGVKIFRVDNPHTKSFRFWEWLIPEIKKEHRDIIFLAEAFTRPKIMARLAKTGFNQSYTYFTWRNSKYELTTYCEELTQTDMKDFFRPNFWTNTPDILPFPLQGAGRSHFVQRLILAATLTPNYGMYGPAYEEMENVPALPGKEEYMNSEKYEIREWDFDVKKGLRPLIARLNMIRRENAALQNMHSLKFHHIENEAVIAYSKQSDDGANSLLMTVNLDPQFKQGGFVGLPLEQFGIEENEVFEVHDLLSGAIYKWQGEHNYVEMDPHVMPAHILKIKKL